MTNPLKQVDAYAAQDRWFELDPNMGTGSSRDECAPKAFDALRAVLGVHRPHENGSLTCVGCSEREDTYDDIPWPCPTIHAITAALGEQPARPQPKPTTRNSIVGNVTGTVIQANRVGELRF